MKTLQSAIAGLLLCTPLSAALAQQLPNPEDAQAQALLARTGMTVGTLAELLRFPLPAASGWPCPVDEALIYTAIGMHDAVPRERWPAAFRKTMEEHEATLAKSLRRAGVEASAVPKDEVTLKQLTPIEARCADGKLDGVVKLALAYDATSLSVQQHFNVATSKVEPIQSRKTAETTRHLELRFVKGEVQGPPLIDVTRGTVMNRLLYEDAAMQKKSDEILKPKPVPIRMAVFSFDDGSVMFTWNEISTFSPSLLGVKESKSQSITTHITVAGRPITLTLLYTDADLTARTRMNLATQNSESVMFMNNYLKPLGKTPRDMPNMENTREVRLNGKDMLEQRSCTVNGQLAKIDPCPVD